MYFIVIQLFAICIGNVIVWYTSIYLITISLRHIWPTSLVQPMLFVSLTHYFKSVWHSYPLSWRIISINQQPGNWSSAGWLSCQSWLECGMVDSLKPELQDRLYLRREGGHQFFKSETGFIDIHYDAMTWKGFLPLWYVVRTTDHRWVLFTKDQKCGKLFSLLFASTNHWTKIWVAGDLRPVTFMWRLLIQGRKSHTYMVKYQFG